MATPYIVYSVTNSFQSIANARWFGSTESLQTSRIDSFAYASYRQFEFCNPSSSHQLCAYQSSEKSLSTYFNTSL